MKSLYLILSFLGISIVATAQSDLRIGQWAEHLPYSGGHTVTQSPTRVYYGTQYALIAINKADSTQAEFFSKVDGLSDVGPSWIKYHHARQTLMVGYANGNLDLIDSTGVTNVNDIVRNTTIQGDKRISHIYVDDTKLAWLCTPFGLLILDLNTLRFNSTVFTSSPANNFVIFQDQYYLSTDNGLYRFNPNAGNLIENFNSWEKISLPELPVNYESRAVGVYQGTLYAGMDGDLYRMEQDEFVFWYSLEGNSVQYISAEGPNLMVGMSCNNDCNGRILYFQPSGFWHENGIDCVGRPTFAVEDEKGRVWYADRFPIFRVAENHFAPCRYLYFNTPFAGSVSELTIKDSELFVATGGVGETYGYLANKDGFYTFDRVNWTTYNQFNTPEIAASGLENFFRIQPHPEQDVIYVGSYWGGLLEFNRAENQYTTYNGANSTLQGAVGDESRIRISGLAFDDEHNLWVCNYLAPEPLSVLKPDGTWQSFDFPCSGSTNLSQIAIDHRGYKWIMLFSKSASLIVFDDGGTIDDLSDDRCIQLSSSNTAIPSNSVNCVEVDRDGDIWVGTAEGPVVFDGNGDIFNGHRGSRVTVEQDGVLNYLLGEETIYSMASDGANRKWFGTGNGVFVQSPAGDEGVISFNKSNSPLLDNRIIDIAIDQFNGVVYIATVGGIMSYRTDAIMGTRTHQESAYAYPNPVRPEYEGPIAVRGLAEDAIVKITDVRGQILYETRALGGQAIWDGRDLNGHKATTGVYLVFSTTESDGFTKPDALVTKILIVN